jgi:hypothetical protein
VARTCGERRFAGACELYRLDGGHRAEIPSAPGVACEFPDIAGYQDHLARFANCDFAVQAKARIEALQKK